MKKLSLIIITGLIVFTSPNVVAEDKNIMALYEKIAILEQRIQKLEGEIMEYKFNNSMALMGTWMVMADKLGIENFREFINELGAAQEEAKKLYYKESMMD